MKEGRLGESSGTQYYFKDRTHGTVKMELVNWEQSLGSHIPKLRMTNNDS